MLSYVLKFFKFICIIITITHQPKAGILYRQYPSPLLAPYKEAVACPRDMPRDNLLYT